MSATGSTVSMTGPGPLVVGELPPGAYTLSPVEWANDSGFADWSCEGADEEAGVVTIAAGANVKCWFSVVLASQGGGVPIATTPTSRTYQPTADTRGLDEFIEDETVGATVEITFDGRAPDENGTVLGLVVGEVAELMVELTVVGASNDSEDLPEGVDEDWVALIGAVNRVTVTCPPLSQDDQGNCEEFEVVGLQPGEAGLNPRDQEFEERTFKFGFKPLVEGEITVWVEVEPVFLFIGDEQPNEFGIDQYEKVIKKFALDVVVSPHEERWRKLRSDAESELRSLLETEVPTYSVIGQPFEVAATFKYPGLEQLEGLEVELLLGTEGWADVSPPGGLVMSDEAVHQTWTVTPYETGRLALDFSLKAKSELVDATYESNPETVFIQVSEPAAPPDSPFEVATEAADSVFSTVVYIAAGLAVVVGLLSALGVKTWWQRRTMLASADADSSEPPSA